MQPSEKRYTFRIASKGCLADEVSLLLYTEDPEMMRLCSSYGNDADKGITFPYMTKPEIVSWLRAAADAIEKTNLD
ncbi:MAG: hypothetical protein WC763_05030 [Candidatus Paceibacterota bacterium]|jgi:hypothetical protein